MPPYHHGILRLSGFALPSVSNKVTANLASECRPMKLFFPHRVEVDVVRFIRMCVSHAR